MLILKCISFLTLLVFVFSKLMDYEDQKLEAYISAASRKINPRYRQTYHISAPVGWMSGPSGFAFFKGQYHLFYQFYPYDAVVGPMHWGHVASYDLVNWRHLPTVLLPDTEECFSGSAIVKDHLLFIMYTGHKSTNVAPFFKESQNMAYSDDGIHFKKFENNPVIESDPNGSPDFRDPKIWQHGNLFYTLIGSRSEDNRGRVLLYVSPDIRNWYYLTVLAESTGEAGYLWECPDFFELNGKHILMISSHGIRPQGERYKNSHQTGYIVGVFNYHHYEFTIERHFTELDLGHDFYAAQTMQKDNRRLLIGWFAMWDTVPKEEEDGWANTMTIVRELSLDDNNRIIMKPADEHLSLRNNTIAYGKFKPKSDIPLGAAAEIILKGDLDKNIAIILEGQEGGDYMWIKWDAKTKRVSVERNGNDFRSDEWNPRSSHRWRIFLDTSSVELFCGEGELVFSTRVYPLGHWMITNVSKQELKIQAYDLLRGVQY